MEDWDNTPVIECSENTATLVGAQIRFVLHRQFLIVCSVCKRVRDDLGRWHEVDWHAVELRFGQFSHGLCPKCLHNLYGECVEDVEL